MNRPWPRLLQASEAPEEGNVDPSTGRRGAPQRIQAIHKWALQRIAQSSANPWQSGQWLKPMAALATMNSHDRTSWAPRHGAAAQRAPIGVIESPQRPHTAAGHRRRHGHQHGAGT